VAPFAPRDERPGFRDRGVYLVTGGLGGIGLAMAERLARDHAARLVLMGGSLPPREEWESLLARSSLPAGLRRRLDGVTRIVEAAGEVEVVPGDVADEADVAAAVRTAIERFGRLDGVLHAAGVPGDGLLQLKHREDAERVMAPKVHGVRSIEAAVAGLDLDLVVLFSSITSFTGGGPGQADYCAANAFLDAYAHDAMARGVARQVVSVSWCEWTWNAWSDGMKAFDPAARSFFEANRACFGLSFEEGWGALARAIASGQAHIAVSTQDLDKMAELSVHFRTDTVGTSVRPDAVRHERPDLPSPYVAPEGPVETAIAELWAAALGLTEIGATDDFFELGGNSLLGVDLVSRLRKQFERPELPPRVLYEAPTVREFADRMAGLGPSGAQALVEVVT
jgi:NAD(P)-dependent dehydrogenase (short-subunit alcohol dehydrogenase family)